MSTTSQQRQRGRFACSLATKRKDVAVLKSYREKMLLTRFLRLVLLLLTCRLVEAKHDGCNFLNEAVATSVFLTIIGMLLVFTLAYFCHKKFKRETDCSNSVPGYDNPIFNIDEAWDSSSLTKNVLKSAIVGDDATSSFQQSKDSFIVLLDRNRPAINAFDVMINDVGGTIVTKVHSDGPVHNKLQKGDVIKSITVFFEDITHADAVRLLMNAAPHKVALTASRNTLKDPNPRMNIGNASCSKSQPHTGGNRQLNSFDTITETTLDHETSTSSESKSCNRTASVSSLKENKDDRCDDEHSPTEEKAGMKQPVVEGCLCPASSLDLSSSSDDAVVVNLDEERSDSERKGDELFNFDDLKPSDNKSFSSCFVSNQSERNSASSNSEFEMVSFTELKEPLTSIKVEKQADDV